MSEAVPEPTPELTPAPVEPTPTPEPPAQEIDWRAEARKWEQRSKTNKTELDELTGKYTAAETERGQLATRLQTYEAEKERAELVADVAKTSGVPASALRGNTREELEAHAADLAELIKPSGPVIPGQERTPDKMTDDPRREFLRSVLNKN
jgi:hypothetical protein